jgi:eukaryotic-like serine/threonine-protein kinase
MDDDLILGRYRPLEELGSGGYAVVTLAYDTRMQRRVAIKRIPLPTDAFGQTAAKAALAEARTAALLNHPAVVTVHEWDTDDGEALLIMEYVDGVAIPELLAELGALDADEAAAVLGPVADALAFAHENGVLHLDVKPDNILVTRDGRVKVTDFGVAALTDALGSATGRGGTLGFMPPEQLRDEPLTERTDEWALAALAYEMLTGRRAFDPADQREALALAERAVPAPPSAIEPTLSEGLDEVLLMGLEADPGQRFATVRELADDLLAELGGDARAGREALGRTVERLMGEETEEQVMASMPLWERFAGSAGTMRRVASGAACLWLAWTGLLPWQLGTLATVLAALVAAAAGVAAPALGLAVALLVLVAGLFALSWVAGLVALPLAIAWWLLIVRRAPWAGTAALAGPLLAAARVAPATPILAGLSGRPLVAAGASAASCLLTMGVSAATGGEAPFMTISPRRLVAPWEAGFLPTSGLIGLRELLHPGPLIVTVGWALSAALVAAAVRRGSPAAVWGAAVLGPLVLFLSYEAWSLIPGATFDFAEPVVLVGVAGAAVVSIAVAVLSPRAET